MPALIKAFNDEGIRIDANYIIGFPDETLRRNVKILLSMLGNNAEIRCRFIMFLHMYAITRNRQCLTTALIMD